MDEHGFPAHTRRMAKKLCENNCGEVGKRQLHH